MSASPTPPASRWREIALAVVVACGAIQTAMVYADPGGPEVAPLSPAARRGLAIWRANNCNTCHQVFGFGGFLGPDLTNVTRRYAPEDLDTVLQEGRNRMPAFGFSRKQRRDLWAFFEALDRSGQSQPDGLRSRTPVDAREHFARLTESVLTGIPSDVQARLRRGARLMTDWDCGSCHRPLAPGRFQAPDLSLVAGYRTRAELAAVIQQGRNTMPGFPLKGEDLEVLLDHLAWQLDWRDKLVAANDRLCDRESFEFSKVPWFEYR